MKDKTVEELRKLMEDTFYEDMTKACFTEEGDGTPNDELQAIIAEASAELESRGEKSGLNFMKVLERVEEEDGADKMMKVAAIAILANS